MSGALNALICLFVWLNWTEFLASFIPNPHRHYHLVTFVKNAVPTALFYKFNQIMTRAALISSEWQFQQMLQICGWNGIILRAYEVLWEPVLFSVHCLKPWGQLSTCVLEMMKRECANHKLCEPFWFDLTTTRFHGLLHSQMSFLQITSLVGIWKCLGSSSHGLDQRSPKMQDHNPLAYWKRC